MKKLVTAIVLGTLPVSAFADFSCSTKVTAVLVYADGSVNVFTAVRNDYTYVCNLETPRLGIEVTTCAMWTAALFDAKKSASNIGLYYSGTGSCATLATYSGSPAPYYLGPAP